MNKIKKFYKENRIFAILITVSAICLLLIIVLLFKYFYGASGNGKYGNRLENLIEFSETSKNEIYEKAKSNDSVTSASIDVEGKIIYVILNLKEGTTLDNGKSLAVGLLDSFSDDIKKVYDIQFSLVESKNYTIMGAKNANSASIVWNNNTPVSSE